ncbi:MAG TPA: hypothetical protein PLF42_01910 [Anaerolineales bacterium]|nr:hypothetical protein [Anaerolineales bacterium]
MAEIQHDILSEKSLSTILRKARVLAHRLKNQEFKNWVESELNGYAFKSTLVPDYRKFSAPLYGDFIGAGMRMQGVSIPPDIFSKKLRSKLSNLVISIGIATIESYIDAANNEKQYELKLPVPLKSIKDFLSNRVVPGMLCLDVWRAISLQQLTQILETVRDRLQKFILELSDIYPDYAKTDFSNNPSISNEKIIQALHQIILVDNRVFVEKDVNIMFDQKNQRVGYQYNAAGNINFNAVGNSTELIAELEKLKSELKKAIQAKAIDDEIGVDVEYKLTKAIQQSKKSQPDKKSILDNLNEAKALLSGISSAVGLVTSLIKAAELVSKFF